MTNQTESYTNRGSSQSDYGGDGDRSERRGGRRFNNRKRMCRLCNKVRCSPEDNYQVDYKDVARLRSFINERGKIEPRRKLSTCALGQRAIARAVKRSRFIGLLPYTLEHVRKSGIFPLRG